jgi:hypothetical protein
MQRRILVVLAALLLGVMGFAAAGCGKKKTTAAPAGGDTTTVVATDTTTTTTSDTTTTDSTTTTESDTTTTTDSETTTTANPDLSFLTSDNCRQLANLYQAFSSAFTGAGQDLDKTAALLDDFASETPEEIRDDFEVIADAYGKIAEALDGVDLGGGQVPSPEVIAKLSALQGDIDLTRLQEASQNISKWAADNCTAG